MTWTGSGAKAIELQFGFEDGTSETAGLIIGSWWSQNPFDGPIRTYVNSMLSTPKILTKL